MILSMRPIWFVVVIAGLDLIVPHQMFVMSSLMSMLRLPTRTTQGAKLSEIELNQSANRVKKLKVPLENLSQPIEQSFAKNKTKQGTLSDLGKLKEMLREVENSPSIADKKLDDPIARFSSLNQRKIQSIKLAKIKEIIAKLEERHDIEIIYAVEMAESATSSSQQTKSNNHHHEIAFVYVSKDTRTYLSLYNKNKCLIDALDGHDASTGIEWHGFDVTNALIFLNQMNPYLVDMVFSPVIYKPDTQRPFVGRVRALLTEQNKRAPLYRQFVDRLYNEQRKDEDMDLYDDILYSILKVKFE